MTMTDTDTCSCGCATNTDVLAGNASCGCGSDGCGEARPKSRDEEIADLLTLRQAVDKRLTELSG
jgi:hypothetical protein